MMQQPIEVLAEKLPDLYECNSQWPICLFDFTFRNVSPKFLTYKVRAELDSFVINDYFQGERMQETKRQRQESQAIS